MGKRFLRESLAKPLISNSKIIDRQDIIQLILKEKIFTELGDMISDIYDLEKLNRKLEMENMHPMNYIIFIIHSDKLLILLILYQKK